MIAGDHLRSQQMSVFCWSIKISPSCKQIYGPWIVSSGKKSNTTTIVSDRRRIWSDHIFLFHTFVTQTFERSLGLIFDFVRKWRFWKSWKSFRLVSKFMDLFIVFSGKKSNTTTIVSDRQRIWSDHIFLFQFFVIQTFQRCLQLFSDFCYRMTISKISKINQIFCKFDGIK